MPYDFDFERVPKLTSLRAEVLELMSRQAANPTMTDREFRAALRNAVVCNRRPAEVLWEKYHTDRTDARDRAYAKYCY